MYINGKNITFTDRSVGSINSYLNSTNKSKPLSIEAEYELWLRMQQGSKIAREQLIYANLRYVVSIAKKYLYSGAALEDLIQAGNEGLIKAVDKFDATFGYHLISYATWYVENEVRKAAYDYISHDIDSLDDPIAGDNEKGATHMDFLPSYPSESTEWNVRYTDALNDMKRRLDKEYCLGTGEMLDDYLAMMEKGYTTSDFARKYRLKEQQMKRFLDMVRTIGRQMLKAA